MAQGHICQVLDAGRHAILFAQLADLVFNVGQGAGTSDLLKLAGALGVINKGDLELVARQSLRLDIDRRRTAGLDAPFAVLEKIASGRGGGGQVSADLQGCSPCRPDTAPG